MRPLTSRDIAINLPRIVRAGDLPKFLKGRPKSFPPITVILMPERDNYIAIEIADAVEMEDGKIEILFEDESIHICEPTLGLREWQS